MCSQIALNLWPRYLGLGLVGHGWSRGQNALVTIHQFKLLFQASYFTSLLKLPDIIVHSVLFSEGCICIAYGMLFQVTALETAFSSVLFIPTCIYVFISLFCNLSDFWSEMDSMDFQITFFWKQWIFNAIQFKYSLLFNCIIFIYKALQIVFFFFKVTHQN